MTEHIAQANRSPEPASRVGALAAPTEPPVPRRTVTPTGQSNRAGLVPRRFYRSFVGLLVGALGSSFVLAVMVGSVSVPAAAVIRIVADHVGIGGTTDINPAIVQVVWDLRVPRALLTIVVGAGLSVAGAVIQVAVRNPLGDPYILGVVAGASSGAVLVIVLGSAAAAGLGVSAAAFVGALLATSATFLLGRRGARLPPTRVVLAGVAVAYLFSAVTFYLQSIATPNELRRAVFWGLGSVAGAQWSDIGLPMIVVVVATTFLMIQGRSLNALLAGDETASSLGVNVIALQIVLLVTASLLSAVVVAVAGGIGFVGLIVPHVARMLVGADHRRALPVTVLVGATFMLLVDLLARTVRRPSELPLGVVTAAIGAPFFLWLLRRNRASGSM